MVRDDTTDTPHPEGCDLTAALGCEAQYTRALAELAALILDHAVRLLQQEVQCQESA